MSEACCEFHPSQGTPERRLPCPRCGTAGKPVARVTLGALLKPAARLRIPTKSGNPPSGGWTKEVPGARFWFCTSPMCEAVYFGPGDVVFAKTDLTVRVGIKESEKPKPLCYCFGFTETAIVEDVKRHGRPTIPDTIKAQVKAGNCYCEVTNPQGSCCLGNISAVVRGLRAPQA